MGVYECMAPQRTCSASTFDVARLRYVLLDVPGRYYNPGAFIYLVYCVMFTALLTAAATVIRTFALLRHGCDGQHDLWTASVEGST
jgi:hypothetical protein